MVRNLPEVIVSDNLRDVMRFFGVRVIVHNTGTDARFVTRWTMFAAADE